MPARMRHIRMVQRRLVMNRLQAWKTVGGSVLALALIVWAGTLYATSKWANPELLVTPDVVKKNIGKSDWVVVDCRGLKDYAKGHIPGAISLGKRCKKALRDPTSRVFSKVSKYESLLGKVGIGNDTHVVFYYGDIKTLTDATVAFWIMEYLGHDKAHVLDGGLDAWRKAGNRLSQKPTKKNPTTFRAAVVSSRYAPTTEISTIAQGGVGTQLIDSRTGAEHAGKDIRALRGGYVPNTTINVSHIDTLAKRKNPKTGKMEPIAYFDPDVAAAAFGGLDRNKRTVAYCQTGTRSTMTYLQLRLMGFKDAANWDDSWRVYGSEVEYPVASEQWYNFSKVNKTLKKLEKRLEKLEATD